MSISTPVWTETPMEAEELTDFGPFEETDLEPKKLPLFGTRTPFFATPKTCPLFDDPSADILLRSGDGTLFRAHRSNISALSVVLCDMLATCAPLSSTNGETEPVPFEEDKEVVEVLLRCCYPHLAPPDFTDPTAHTLIKCGRAAHKYQCGMLQALVSATLLVRIKEPGFLIRGVGDWFDSVYDFAFVIEDAALMRYSALQLVSVPPWTKPKEHQFDIQTPAWEQLCLFAMARRVNVSDTLVRRFSIQKMKHHYNVRNCNSFDMRQQWESSIIQHLSDSPSEPLRRVPSSVVSAAGKCQACRNVLGTLQDVLDTGAAQIPDDVLHPMRNGERIRAFTSLTFAS